MFSRRDFLKTGFRGASLIALSPTVPGFLAATARSAPIEADARILVVIQLDGGNDGINTVVPYRDEGYARHRRSLRLPTNRLIKVADGIGLHPSLGDAARLLESGWLSIVPGVGYPNPSRSHFRSMAVWQTARLDPEEHRGPGWLGRVGDDVPSAGAIFLGSETSPAALRGRRSSPASVDRLRDFMVPGSIDPKPATEASRSKDELSGFVRRSLLDAYSTADRLAELARTRKSDEPEDGLLGHLMTMVRLIKSGARTRIYYALQGGYDTHAQQLRAHASLLRDLGYALKSFFDELSDAKLADRVVVLCFSEFGRRVGENASNGTDHGTSGPIFLAGPSVQPGLVGPYPSLSDLEDGDLKVAIDFRRVYASVLEKWLGISSSTALGGSFPPLPLLRA
jgi:uncharacterized protein (DUF1501 family)